MSIAPALFDIIEPRSRRSPMVQHLVISWALMVPFIFFAVHGTFSFQDTGNNQSHGSSLSGLVTSGRNLGIVGYLLLPGLAYSIVLWLITTNAKRIASCLPQMKLILLLAVLPLVSATWSQDPLRSSYNGLFYLIDTLFAVCLIVKFEPEEIMSLSMMGGTLLASLSIVMILLLPQFALVHEARDMGAWQGIFIDRTSAAKCMIFLLSPAIILRRRSWSVLHLPYIAVMTLLIFMAQAMTARLILFLYVIFMVILALSRRLERKCALLIGMTALILMILLGRTALSYMPVVLQSFGRDSTLTGRVYIWGAVLGSIAKRPLFGYGYYAFWQGLKGESANIILASNWVFGYAHNGILEICLQLGLVGTLIFFATLCQAIKNAWLCVRHGSSAGVEWYLGLIALTILYNVDESTVVWPHELLSILYIVACCGLARAARQLRTSQMIGTVITNV